MRNLDKIKELLEELISFCVEVEDPCCNRINCATCPELDRIARIIEAEGD